MPGESPTAFNNEPDAGSQAAFRGVIKQDVKVMNSDEIGNLVRQGATFILANFAGGAYMNGAQSIAIATGLGAVASVIWSVYKHWNMVKVPETSVAAIVAKK